MIKKILLNILFLLPTIAQTIQNVPIKTIHFFKNGKTLVEHQGTIMLNNKTAYVSLLSNADLKTIKVYSNDKINVAEINLPLHIKLSRGSLHKLVKNISNIPVSITYKINETEADLIEGIVVDIDTVANMLYLKKKLQEKEIITVLPIDRIIQIDITQKKLRYIEIKSEKPTASLNIKYKYFIKNIEWEPATDYEVKDGSFFLKKEVWIRYFGDEKIPESNCIFYDTEYSNDVNSWKEAIYCQHTTEFLPYSSKRITCGSELIDCNRKVNIEIPPTFTIKNFPLDTVPYRQKITKKHGVLECFLGKHTTNVPAPEMANKIIIRGKEKVTDHWENIEYQGKSFQIFFIEGNILIENTSNNLINIKLIKNITGIIEQAPKSNVLQEVITSPPNRKTKLEWNFQLKPQDVFIILYKYKLYVPQLD